MTLIDGQSGSAPAGKCGFLSRKHPVCPAPASAATGAPSHIWRGAVLSPYGGCSDKLANVQPRLAGVIEGRPGDIPARSDLSPSSTFPFLCRTTVYHRYYAERTARQGTSHRYAYALADCRGGKPLTGQRRYTAGAAFLAFLGNRRSARSGGGYGLWPATALLQSSPHYRRNLGNPCAEKVRPHRPRQSFA